MTTQTTTTTTEAIKARMRVLLDECERREGLAAGLSQTDPDRYWFHQRIAHECLVRWEGLREQLLELTA